MQGQQRSSGDGLGHVTGTSQPTPRMWVDLTLLKGNNDFHSHPFSCNALADSLLVLNDVLEQDAQQLAALVEGRLLPLLGGRKNQQCSAGGPLSAASSQCAVIANLQSSASHVCCRCCARVELLLHRFSNLWVQVLTALPVAHVRTLSNGLHFSTHCADGTLCSTLASSIHVLT